MRESTRDVSVITQPSAAKSRTLVKSSCHGYDSHLQLGPHFRRRREREVAMVAMAVRVVRVEQAARRR